MLVSQLVAGLLMKACGSSRWFGLATAAAATTATVDNSGNSDSSRSRSRRT